MTLRATVRDLYSMKLCGSTQRERLMNLWHPEGERVNYERKNENRHGNSVSHAFRSVLTHSFMVREVLVTLMGYQF